MNTSSIDGSQWAALAALDSAERERAMREHLESVLALPEEGREAALREMITAEYALSAADLQRFTLSRLRTWIGIAQEDPAAAQGLARGYDRVFDGLPADIAMRRPQVVQAVAKDLTGDELESLFEIIPSLVRQLPRRTDTTESRPARRPLARPWWKFWGGAAVRS